jgi:protein arginine kinase
VQEAWARLNLLDDTLNSLLDFSFSERLGFLTALLAHVGTGFKLGVLLHLPALTLSGRLGDLAARAEQQRLLLTGVRAGGTPDARLERMRLTPVGEESRPASRLDQSFFTDVSGSLSAPIGQTEGDLFMLVNQGTLGLSEEEIIFQVRHIASECVAEERSARELLISENARVLEDRVGRAVGLAGGARLLNFSEGVGCISSLRLGVSTGLLQGHTLHQLNDLLLAGQGAHLEMSAGVDCDSYRLSVERADLFRSRFGSDARKF